MHILLTIASQKYLKLKESSETFTYLHAHFTSVCFLMSCRWTARFMHRLRYKFNKQGVYKDQVRPFGTFSDKEGANQMWIVCFSLIRESRVSFIHPFINSPCHISFAWKIYHKSLWINIYLLSYSALCIIGVTLELNYNKILINIDHYKFKYHKKRTTDLIHVRITFSERCCINDRI